MLLVDIHDMEYFCILVLLPGFSVSLVEFASVPYLKNQNFMVGQKTTSKS